MRSFLRNRRFKNFAFKTDVLCSCLLLNSNAVPKKLLFEHTSIEETYKKAKVGISFYKAQGASDFPLPNPLTLIINVKSGEEWGMQYALTSVGKIFTRPVNNGVFTDWIQV
jgi:hypothetical protein|nr:MAG TPA: hypothetical protein [Caudoviricetes sp.]